MKKSNDTFTPFLPQRKFQGKTYCLAEEKLGGLVGSSCKFIFSKCCPDIFVSYL